MENIKEFDKIYFEEMGMCGCGNPKETKYFLCCCGRELQVTDGSMFRSNSITKHFKSREIGEQIIKKFDNEKLIK